jgi:hypothetical protein
MRLPVVSSRLDVASITACTSGRHEPQPVPALVASHRLQAACAGQDRFDDSCARHAVAVADADRLLSRQSIVTGSRRGHSLRLDRADLELRHAADWIEHRVGEPVDRLRASPVKRHEHRVLADRQCDPARQLRGAAPGGQRNLPSARESEPCGSCRVDLGERRGRQWLQLGDRSRLRSRLVLREQTTSGEVQGVVLVSGFGGSVVMNGMEPRPAARCRKSFDEQSRRARMGEVRTGQNRPSVAANPFVRDALVVGCTPVAREPQLVEDVARIARRKEVASSERRTTSASAAVSDKRKSETTRRSSFRSRC